MKLPRWKALRDKLIIGCEYHVKGLSEEVRMVGLKVNLERGNHKSAKRNERFLGKAMKKEIEKGWVFYYLKKMQLVS